MYSHKKPDFSGVSEIKWNGRNERMGTNEDGAKRLMKTGLCPNEVVRFAH